MASWINTPAQGHSYTHPQAADPHRPRTPEEVLDYLAQRKGFTGWLALTEIIGPAYLLPYIRKAMRLYAKQWQPKRQRRGFNYKAPEK